MNRDWLLSVADYPIKYSLTRDPVFIDGLLANADVALWLSSLGGRVASGGLADIHGSHDYRYENIIKKCFVLGLDSRVPEFDAYIAFYINFLNEQIVKEHGETLTFGKMYQFRDYETVLACYLPLLGYANEPCVRFIAEKRANLLYGFTKQGRYDIYADVTGLPGIKKEWKPFIVDPALYADGNIRVPTIHDFILFAGMYSSLDEAEKVKVETIVGWIFSDSYKKLIGNYYFYAPQDPAYKTKSLAHRLVLPEVSDQDGNQGNLLFLCYIFSHFKTARSSVWFCETLGYLESFKNADGRYVFPPNLIIEQKDGPRMNPGEQRKNPFYAEIVSTYWMERIYDNLDIFKNG
jgi:hypothetical protein